MAPSIRRKGRKRSAHAEKTKTPQVATVGPSKLTEKLVATVESVESLLKLANAFVQLVRLAFDAYKHLKDIIT